MLAKVLQLQILGKKFFIASRTHMQYSVKWFIILDEEVLWIRTDDIFLWSKDTILTTILITSMWLMPGSIRVEVSLEKLCYRRVQEISYTPQ